MIWYDMQLQHLDYIQHTYLPYELCYSTVWFKQTPDSMNLVDAW